MLISLLLALAPANAAEPKFVGTDKAGEAVEKPEAKLTAELGGALTTGNSEFYTLTAGLNGSYRFQRSKFSLVGGAVTGSSRVDADGNGTLDDDERQVPMVQNAKRFYGDLRYDFFISGHDSLYALVGAFHDPFSGYRLRSHEQVGYSRMLLKTDDTQLVAELGADWAQEYYFGDVDPSRDVGILAARVMVGLNHKFSEGVGFQDTLEVYENVIDTADLRILNSASMVSALSSKLSLKLSHNLIFDNRPVGYGTDAAKRPLDQTMQVTLVASIL